MPRRFRLSTDAQEDIEQAGDWYEARREGLGVLFAGELVGLSRRIRMSPLQFPEVAPGIRRGLMRRFPYAVYFSMDENQILVIAVFHQRRDPEAMLDRD